MKLLQGDNMAEAKWIKDQKYFEEMTSDIWKEIPQRKPKPNPATYNKDQQKIKRLEHRIQELENTIQQLEKEREPCPPGGACMNDPCIQCGQCDIYQSGDW